MTPPVFRSDAGFMQKGFDTSNSESYNRKHGTPRYSTQEFAPSDSELDDETSSPSRAKHGLPLSWKETFDQGGEEIKQKLDETVKDLRPKIKNAEENTEALVRDGMNATSEAYEKWKPKVQARYEEWEPKLKKTAESALQDLEDQKNQVLAGPNQRAEDQTFGEPVEVLRAGADLEDYAELSHKSGARGRAFLVANGRAF